MKILFIYRDKRPGNYSIESLFDTIRKYLPSVFNNNVYTLPSFNEKVKGIFALRKEKADIYHITGDVNFLSLGTPKSKTILTIHDLGNLDFNTGFRKWLIKWIWFGIPLRKVSYVTTISDFTKSRLLHYFNFPENRIKVVYNFVAPEFKFSPKVFNVSNPTVLVVGTQANKNLPRLFEAVKGLPLNFVFVGKLKDEYKQLLTDTNLSYEEHFHLTREQVVNLYQRADIVSFISSYEGFGLPIIEAQATGRVVITSTICAMPEVAGEGALLVNPSNTNDIREAFVKVMSDEMLRNKLIESGQKNIQRFTIDKTVQGYVDLYNTINKKI